MKGDSDSIPTDIDELTNLVKELRQQVAYQSLFIDQLLEQIKLARHQRFGVRSEHISPDQLRLLLEDNSKDTTKTPPIDVDPDASGEVTSKPPSTNPSKRGRRKLPDHLPRVDVEHTLDEGACQCEHCQGEMEPLSQKITEQLDIIPAQVRVIRHHRQTYHCTKCDDAWVTAPMPPQPIPKGNATAATLVFPIIAKYLDGLPLFRIERQLKRLGCPIPRATLANWMIHCGQLIQPLINLMTDRVLSYDIVAMDESRFQVLNEQGKSAQSQSYIWVQRGGPPESPVVFYHYDPTRSQEVPLRLLDGFKGYLQTDAYEGYSAICRKNKLVPVGCMAHARRKFDEALKAQGAVNTNRPKSTLAATAIKKIQQLYRIERETKHLTDEQRQQVRQSRSVPILNELRHWLDEHLFLVPPKSALGKATHYLDTQWDKLTVYTTDGRLRIDNNLTENAIRPFVIRRKNWMFSTSVNGANASANLYSLVETARANGLEPYDYLHKVITELPAAKTVEDIERLLPFNQADSSQQMVA